MFVNAHQSESRYRKNSPRIPAKRISKGLLHRGNCGKNWRSSEHYLKIRVRTGKSWKDKDFKDRGESQNVCSRKAIDDAFNKLALKLEKAEKKNSIDENRFYGNSAFQFHDLNCSICKKELRIEGAFICKDLGNWVEKETNEWDISQQGMIFLGRDCFEKEVKSQKLDFRSSFPGGSTCLQ
ncbi:MAG: hypothetical protein ABSF44_09610 [Candidatus Bathyarchaeia archaeon]|jgi:hypothetical protein